MEHLGHIIRPGTLEVNQACLKFLKKVAVPRTLTQLRSFLGLCNVYRRFVENYAKIASPLAELLRKGMPDPIPDFTTAQMTAFRTLISVLCSPPVLRLPKVGLPFSIGTDACDGQIGATLL